MFDLRRNRDRGRSHSDWLVSRHSLSFGGFDDPDYRRFRTMEVLNDDVIAAGAGFSPHGHDNVEIISYIVRGRLAHEDSTGHAGTLEAGEVQRISAGTGIRHREFNDSDEMPLRLIQMWFTPSERETDPDYEQGQFPTAERRDRFRLLVSPDGRDGSLRINSDVALYGGLFGAQRRLAFELGPDRYVWFHVVGGEVEIAEVALGQGDGLVVGREESVSILTETDAEIIAVEMP